MPDTPQARKLGLRPGLRVALDGPPSGWAFDRPPGGLLPEDADGSAEHALALGLVDVKVAAIDGDWSGLRLAWRRQNR